MATLGLACDIWTESLVASINFWARCCRSLNWNDSSYPKQAGAKLNWTSLLAGNIQSNLHAFGWFVVISIEYFALAFNIIGQHLSIFVQGLGVVDFLIGLNRFIDVVEGWIVLCPGTERPLSAIIKIHPFSCGFETNSSSKSLWRHTILFRACQKWTDCHRTCYANGQCCSKSFG